MVVSKILGHSKTSTTLDIYGHLIPVMQEEAARIMDEVITPIPVDFGENMEAETLESAPRCTSIEKPAITAGKTLSYTGGTHSNTSTY